MSAQSVIDWASGLPFFATCVAFNKASCIDLTDSLKRKSAELDMHLTQIHVLVWLLTWGDHTQSDSAGWQVEGILKSY